MLTGFPRTDARLNRFCASVCMGLLAVLAAAPASAAEAALGKSFVEQFDHLDPGRWYTSDGWSNGDFQNCTWSKQQVRIQDGILQLGFANRRYKERDNMCAEVQTRPLFGYGIYEARIKAAAGSGLNSAFFSYIGPAQKQPHDEIDFEVLGRNPAEVQLNQFVSGKSVGGHARIEVPGGADKGFNDYAFVWEKDRLRFFVNGVQVGEETDPAKIPTHPSKIFLSLWGTDKLTDWMGAFEAGTEATVEVDRVAYTALGEPCQFPESLACKLAPQASK